MFELGPGPQHPSQQLAVLEKGAGLRSHTFFSVLSTVGPEPPNPRASLRRLRAGSGPVGPEEPQAVPTRVSEEDQRGISPAWGGHADRGAPPGHLPGSPPPGAERGLRELRRQPADGDRRLLRGRPARPLRSPLSPAHSSGLSTAGTAGTSVRVSVRPSPPRRGVPPAAATGGLRAARGAAGLPLRELPVREHAPPPGSRVGKGCPGPVPIPGGLASCLGVRTALRTWGERRRAACEPCCSSRGFYSSCPRLATRVGSDLLSPPAPPPRAMLCLILHF